MNELKTLKDLNSEMVLMDKEEKWVMESELRQEAIKWVKSCKVKIDGDWEGHRRCGDSFLGRFKNNGRRRCKNCKWIINFFNLTEDDLK